MKTRIQQIGVSLEQDVYKQDDWPWVSFNGISLFIINLPVYNIVSLHLEGRRICQREEYNHLYPSRGRREDRTWKGQQVCWDFWGNHQCAQPLGDISPASTHLTELHHCYLCDYYTLSPSWVGSWWSQVSKGMLILL